MSEQRDTGRSRSTSWGKLLKSKNGAVFAEKKLIYMSTKERRPVALEPVEALVTR
jgi:hypothetical protein